MWGWQRGAILWGSFIVLFWCGFDLRRRPCLWNIKLISLPNKICKSQSYNFFVLLLAFHLCNIIRLLSEPYIGCPYPCPWVLSGHGCDIIVHGWAYVNADECGLGMDTNSKEMLGSNYYQSLCFNNIW